MQRSPHMSLQAQRGGGGMAQPFATSALERGGWSARRHGFLSPEKTRYPLHRSLGGPRGRSGTARKISPPQDFDPLPPTLTSYI